MISRIILGSVFAIITFAGMADAQHVKVIDGTRLGTVTPSGQTAQIYRNVNGAWTVLNSDAAVVQAGSTIRLRIAATNNRGKLIVGVDNVRSGGKLFVATDVGVYQVPCDGAATRIGLDAGSQLTIAGTVSDPVLDWKTEKTWRGTCRMLTVKLRNGTEARAKLRFE
jgi:hypothetical protein